MAHTQPPEPHSGPGQLTNKRGCLIIGLLTFGIIFLPPVFVWFLLRRGYPIWARIAGFVWLALWLLVAFTPRVPEGSSVSDERSEVAEPAAQIADVPEASNADAAIAVYRQVLEAVGPCDALGQAMSTIAANVGSGSSFTDAYRAANAARAACTDSYQAIEDIEVPRTIRAAFREPLESCSSAYVMKSATYRQFADAFDNYGSIRPSEMAELEDTSRAAQAGQLQCVAGLMRAATESGATIEQLAADSE